MKTEWTVTHKGALFERQKAAVEKEIARMNRVLDMLKYKYWYYGEAITDGNEARLSGLVPEELPGEIRQAYQNARRKSGLPSLGAAAGKKKGKRDVP